MPKPPIHRPRPVQGCLSIGLPQTDLLRIRLIRKIRQKQWKGIIDRKFRGRAGCAGFVQIPWGFVEN